MGEEVVIVNNASNIELFGLQLLNRDPDDVCQFIQDSVMLGLCFSLATPNVDHFVRIEKYPDVKQIYKQINYCVNDSRILSLLLQIFFGLKLRTVTGSDLTALLFKSDVIRKKKVAIIGSSKPEITKLTIQYKLDPNLVAHYEPPMHFIKNIDAVKQTVNFAEACGADIIFLAVGSPQQEIVSSQIQRKLSHGVILCVGASIDYLTGKEKRAPKFIQAMYLEWLFRFAQSPIKRFRRYFINCPQIIYYLLRERYLSK